MLRFVWFDRQLRAGKFPTAQAYAEQFEVAQRTAYRDVEYFFDLSGLDGVKRWVMSYGSHAEVLAPASLRREVAAEARRMARVYRAPAGEP